MTGLVRVVRLQLVNKQTFVWMPLVVLVGVVGLSIGVFALIPYDGVKYSGAGQAPLWYMFAVGIMALTRTFPFSQAMSVTRRDYLVGTYATAGLTSAALATLFLLGTALERATGGWGVNGLVFAYEPLTNAGPVLAWLAYVALGLLFFGAGVLAATLYKRFGALWLTVISILWVAALLGLTVLVATVDPFTVWMGSLLAAGLWAWLLVAALVVLAQAAITHRVLLRTLP